MMETGNITYNPASGKLYQGGLPYLNRTFKNEAEAQTYLIKLGLKLYSTELKPPPSSQIQK